MPMVSIIMPVYNAMPYLQEAVKSILAQKYTDFELICVDDGSNDMSLNFLKKMQAIDRRITVLQQLNQGAGVARNYGMSIASGTYISFLDADDIFFPNLFSEVVACAEKNDADITIYKFESYHNLTKKKRSCDYAFQKEQWNSDIISWHDNPTKIFTSFNPCTWNKLFKKSFIDALGLQFQNNKRTNDLFFTTMAMALAKKISLLDKVLLYYRIGNNNSSQSTNNIAEFDFFNALLAVKEALVKKNLMSNLQIAFNELVTNTVIHNINVSKDQGLKIYNFLCRSGLKRLGIEISSLPRLEKFFSRYQLLNFKKRMEKSAATSASLLLNSNINIDIKVSVIIPVYNVKDYLLECLKSVSTQTLKNIEIIAINDGSTDESLKLLCEYRKKENRLKILNQSNAGLSMARNNGVQFARGEYLYFLDSDDFINGDCLEKLYRKAKKDDLDILFFDAETFIDFQDVGFKRYFTHYKKYYKRKGDYSKTCNGIELLVNMYKNDDYRASATLQLIKRRFYLDKQLAFYPGLLYEDNLFTFQELIVANKVAHIKKAFYQRRIRKDSIVTKEKTFCDAYSYYICWKEMAKSMLLCNLENKQTNKVFNNLLKHIKMSYVNIFNGLSGDVQANIAFLSADESIDWKISLNKPNFINRTIRCYCEHGMKITMKKILNKILIYV